MRRHFMLIFIIMIMLSYVSHVALSVSMQSIIRVPTDYATIQDAILNAPNGSIILVEQGVYNECNILVSNKQGVTITGEPGATIVCHPQQAEGLTRVFIIEHSTDVAIRNLTLEIGEEGVMTVQGFFVQDSRDIGFENLIIRPAASASKHVVDKLFYFNATNSSASINNLTVDSGLTLGYLLYVSDSNVPYVSINNINIMSLTANVLSIRDTDTAFFTVQDVFVDKADTLVYLDDVSGRIILQNVTVQQQASAVPGYSVHAVDVQSLTIRDSYVGIGKDVFVTDTVKLEIVNSSLSSDARITVKNMTIINSSVLDIEVHAANIHMENVRARNITVSPRDTDESLTITARNIEANGSFSVSSLDQNSVVEDVWCRHLYLYGGSYPSPTIRNITVNASRGPAARIYAISGIQNLTIKGTGEIGFEGFNVSVDGMSIVGFRYGLIGYNVTIRDLDAKITDYLVLGTGLSIGEGKKASVITIDNFHLIGKLLYVSSVGDRQADIMEYNFIGGTIIFNGTLVYLSPDEYIDVLNLTMKLLAGDGEGMNESWLVYLGYDDPSKVRIVLDELMFDDTHGLMVPDYTKIVLADIVCNDSYASGYRILDILDGVAGVTHDAMGAMLVVVRNSRNIVLQNYTSPDVPARYSIIIYNSTNITLERISIGPVPQDWPRKGNKIMVANSSNVTIRTVKMGSNMSAIYVLHSQHIYIYMNTLYRENIIVNIGDKNVTLHSPYPLTYTYNGKQYHGILGNQWLTTKYNIGFPLDANNDGILEMEAVIDKFFSWLLLDPAPLADNPENYTILGPATGLPDLEASIPYYDPQTGLLIVEARAYNTSCHGKTIYIVYTETGETLEHGEAYYRTIIPVNLTEHNITPPSNLTLTLVCGNTTLTLSAGEQQAEQPPQQTTSPQQTQTTPHTTPEQEEETATPTGTTQPTTPSEGGGESRTAIVIGGMLAVIIIAVALVLLKKK